jgi:prepilin-type N-terminal cleavage/methylation domain-containing protein
MFKNSPAFTLLELMIVIGILVILTTLTLPYGVNFYNARALDEETANVASILERARTHAISGKEDSDWGVQFVSTNQYTIFKGSTCGGTVYQTFNLIQGAEIESEINCIIFERHTGTPRIYNN